MSNYSYETLVEMMWRERADELFAKNNVEKKLDKKKDPHPEYTKLSEWAHGKLFHQHLKKLWLKHTHIGNEAGQAGTKNIVIMMSKKKAQGTSKGFPDYVILIPSGKHNIMLLVELKKARGVMGGLNGSTIDEEQITWIQELTSTVGVFAHICHGSDEAIDLVDEYIAEYMNLTPKEVLLKWASEV